MWSPATGHHSANNNMPGYVFRVKWVERILRKGAEGKFLFLDSNEKIFFTNTVSGKLIRAEPIVKWRAVGFHSRFHSMIGGRDASGERTPEQSF